MPEPAGSVAAQWRTAPAPVDAADYDLEDAAGTVGGVPHRWRWTVADLDDIDGAALVALEAIADVLGAAGGTGDTLPDLAAGVEAALRDEAATHGARVGMVDALGAHHPLCIATEECERLLSAAARAVVLGMSAPGAGVVERVGTSAGGPDKASVAEASIGPRGLSGDRQATRRHHGRPFQAVSLFSAEVIDELRAEGHPISPGSVGENLTLSGLDWPRLRIGTRLVLGTDAAADASAEEEDGAVVPGDGPAVVEVTSWAPPCTKIASSFVGGDHLRIDHDHHPGWSRAYARVLRPGRVVAGGGVRVLP